MSTIYFDKDWNVTDKAKATSAEIRKGGRSTLVRLQKGNMTKKSLIEIEIAKHLAGKHDQQTHAGEEEGQSEETKKVKKGKITYGELNEASLTKMLGTDEWVGRDNLYDIAHDQGIISIDSYYNGNYDETDLLDANAHEVAASHGYYAHIEYDKSEGSIVLKDIDDRGDSPTTLEDWEQTSHSFSSTDMTSNCKALAAAFSDKGFDVEVLQGDGKDSYLGKSAFIKIKAKPKYTPVEAYKKIKEYDKFHKLGAFSPRSLEHQKKVKIAGALSGAAALGLAGYAGYEMYKEYKKRKGLLKSSATEALIVEEVIKHLNGRHDQRDHNKGKGGSARKTAATKLSPRKQSNLDKAQAELTRARVKLMAHDEYDKQKKTSDTIHKVVGFVKTGKITEPEKQIGDYMVESRRRQAQTEHDVASQKVARLKKRYNISD